MTERATLTVGEAAEMLGVSLPTAYTLSHSQGFPSFTIGRKLLISKDGLQRWIAEKTTVQTSEYSKRG